jgi:hypothetical protein
LARRSRDKPLVVCVVSGVWPNAEIALDVPPSACAAQHLARELGKTMADSGTAQWALAAASVIAHTTIGRILAGPVLRDIGSLARLKHTLGRQLWPERVDAVTLRRSGGKTTTQDHTAV